MARQIIYTLVGALILFVVGAMLGLFTGMNIGGNYFPTFQFRGMVGYQATGEIGLWIGGFLGAIVGGLLGNNYAKRNRKIQ